MPKIRKVVTTVWYNKKNMYALRRVFPEAEFVYVPFYDKDTLEQEARAGQSRSGQHGRRRSI